MNLIKYVLNSLGGALRLARFDAKGFAALDVSESGFWRSFWAALVGWPFFLLLSSLQRNLRGPEAIDIFAAVDKLDLSHFYLLQSLSYFALWPLFAVVMAAFCRLFKLGRHYIPLIVGYNWARVVFTLILIPPYLFILVVPTPELVALIFTIFASLFTLVYYWFVGRLAFGGASWRAAAAVLVDAVLRAAISFGMTLLFSGFVVGLQ